MASSIPKLPDLIEEAKLKFQREYGFDAHLAFFAPGRVNLIGDNTDFYDGCAILMAIPLITVLVGKTIPGEESHMISLNAPAAQTKKASFYKPIIKGSPKWSNYPKGILLNVCNKKALPAFNACLLSSIPLRAGLGSSAALELCTYEFLEFLGATKTSTSSSVHKALVCHNAENTYVNRPCSTSEQICCAAGKKNHWLVVNCRDNTFERIPIQDNSVYVVLIYSGIKSTLDGNEYNERREKCKLALNLIKKTGFREVNPDEIENLRKYINYKDIETIMKRARHVCTEIRRARKAVTFLKENNYERFGALMFESQESLKNDFDISCTEIDEIIEITKTVKGVYGSRLTGRGFGGYVATLVQHKAIKKLIETVKSCYKSRIPKFYICKPFDGSGQYVSEKIEELTSGPPSVQSSSLASTRTTKSKIT